MAKTKSLYELKQDGLKKKNPNTITDADYFLRDKEEEAKAGYPNSIDMTPAPKAPARKTTAKAEEE
jgi:hypothetical protein